ncbi:MAG: transposase [Candidatus Paceibacteria bacterium]
MSNDKVSTLNTPEEINDPLQAVLQDGAQRLLKQAIEAEVQALLETHSELKTKNNKRAVVRSGYLPRRTVQTGLGDVSVQVPKVRDRNGTGIKFTSHIVPPYLKRSKTIEAFLPWLYLRGVSTGDFSEALKYLLGEQAPIMPPRFQTIRFIHSFLLC